MKKFSTRGRGSLYALMAFFCLMPAAVYAGFSFTRPELPLDADGHESIPQWGTHVAFDNAGGLHAVWSDDRNSPLGPHVYGTVIQSNGSVLIPYRAYHGTDSYAYNEAFITRNMNFTDKMYVFATENRLGPNLYAGISHWNLNDLPAEPAVVDLTETMLQSSMFASREDMDVIAYGDYIVYAYELYPNIYLRRYDINANSWDTAEEVIMPLGGQDLQNPRLAIDDDKYVYLSYEIYDSSVPRWYPIIRRSQTPEVIDNFHIEVYLPFSDVQAFDGDLAVAGPSTGPYCAFVYEDPESSMGELVCNMDVKSDWDMDSWGGGVYSFSSPGAMFSVLGPRAEFDADGETLYVVWADNSLGNDEVFGAVSHDGGLTFENKQQLTDNAQPLLESPVIATGTQPGFYAVAYSRLTSGSSSPFVLYSIPEFFDRCDGPPSTYWDSYPGVTLATTPVYSPPTSYQMASADKRGQLVSEYGSVEQTGGVNLFFYDDTSITSTNFYVALENNNARGVIRMLGVRNETTQNNYSYSMDGVTWEDLGIARSTGWHNVVMTANETEGLTMYIDDPTAAQTDPTFQTFTRVIIDGGTDADPYFVDDMAIHAIPLLDERPLPVSSPFFLALTLLVIGAVLVLRRK